MTAWPVVKARMVAALPTLAGWDVVTTFNGPPVTSSAPPNYVTVGYVVGEAMAGDYTETPGVGDVDNETGTIRSELVCSTGATDLPTVEALAFALADQVQAWVKANRTLGVLRPGSTSNLAVDVIPSQTTSGAEQRLVLSLTYTAVS